MILSRGCLRESMVCLKVTGSYDSMKALTCSAYPLVANESRLIAMEIIGT